MNVSTQGCELIKGLKTKEQISKGLRSVLPKNLTCNDVIFFCIGTDRSTGDTLGPLVGTLLQGKGYKNVLGTVKQPVHAMNLSENMSKIPEGKIVIAIDACLGNMESVDTVQLNVGGISPGAGVNKVLPHVGDFSITGIVNVGGFMEYFVLQNTRLSIVLDMAEAIAAALTDRFPIESKHKMIHRKKPVLSRKFSKRYSNKR